MALSDRIIDSFTLAGDKDDLKAALFEKLAIEICGARGAGTHFVQSIRDKNNTHGKPSDNDRVAVIIV